MNGIGANQNTDVEQWLYGTYPLIHKIWKHAFTNRYNLSLNLELNCTICKVKPSSGMHYGVKICEADKQFLKRTFHHKIKYPECTKLNNVEICPPRPRGWCQLCRLTACLSAPVNIFMIRVGESSTRGNQTKYNHEETVSIECPPQYNLNIIKPCLEKENSFKHEEPNRYSISLAPSYNYYPSLQSNCIPSTNDKIDSSRFSLGVEEREVAPRLTVKKELLKEAWEEILVFPESSVKKELLEEACLPLDLSRKSKQTEMEDQWYIDELNFVENACNFTNVNDNLEEPLDLTTPGFVSSNCSPNKSWLEKYSKPFLSRSLNELKGRSTPSPGPDGNNKFSINSTVLGNALAQIQGNISVSSLANLSSLSDILSESDKVTTTLSE